MFVTNQIRIIFVSCYHFNVFQAILRMSFDLWPPVYIYVQENSCSKYFDKASRICLARLQGSLKYVCLKHFSKTFELEFLQGSNTVKNILLNFLNN